MGQPLQTRGLTLRAPWGCFARRPRVPLRLPRGGERAESPKRDPTRDPKRDPQLLLPLTATHTRYQHAQDASSAASAVVSVLMMLFTGSATLSLVSGIVVVMVGGANSWIKFAAYEDRADLHQNGAHAPPRVTESAAPPCVTESAAHPRVTESVAPPCVTESAAPPCVTKSAVPPRVTESAAPPCVTKNVVPPRVTESVAPPCVTKGTVPPCVTESAQLCCLRMPEQLTECEPLLFTRGSLRATPNHPESRNVRTLNAKTLIF
eukprot:1178768-Prorocentrum_minimum.AAC.2